MFPSKLKRLRSCSSIKKCKVDEEVDRISELPEPILHHILSLLPIKDAPKTSVLSKTWYSVWNSFPLLDFDECDYFHNTFPDDPAMGQGFYNYVSSSIARRCQNDNVSSLQRFSLVVCLDNRPPPLLFSRTYIDKDLERFINYALSNNVEHLALDYVLNSAPAFITQASPLFRPTNSLKVLHLSNFNIVFEEEEEESVSSSIIGSDQNFFSGCYFSSLKKLHLIWVYVDDQTLQRFLSNASSLEDFSITLCYRFRSLSLCSPKLKSVRVHVYEDEVPKVTIEAPNLRSLVLGGPCTDVLSSVLEASSKGYAKNLKELELRRVPPINGAIFRVIHGFGGVLEKLTLFRCLVRRSVRVSSCGLISSNSTVKYNNNDVELTAYCLDCKKREKKKGTRSQMEDGLYKLRIK